MAMQQTPANPPGSRFVYSDINFELLGEIVHRLSGLPENEYVQKNFFTPLGMTETKYLPAAVLRPRTAPTEMQPDGTILRGLVHDPTSRRMGGVAGHAGLFSTAGDVAIYAQNLLDPAAQPVDGEQPPVHARDADDHGHDDGRPEQRAEERTDEVHDALGQQRAPCS